MRSRTRVRPKCPVVGSMFPCSLCTCTCRFFDGFKVCLQQLAPSTCSFLLVGWEGELQPPLQKLNYNNLICFCTCKLHLFIILVSRIQVGARLISHAGSLTNLAKYPASTVQILGAEKALFRYMCYYCNTCSFNDTVNCLSGNNACFVSSQIIDMATPVSSSIGKVIPLRRT